ncbi:MAG TPA: tetratricopeptide repeat protein, partial [Rubrobacter sp.]|nr:tetratricopeptide repeat protein [Rubrobacter sp.]
MAEELGDLPLALELAAAYIVTTNQSISSYFDLFRRQRSELESGGGRPPVSVAATWGVAFEEVEKRSPGGADLLRLFAFLAPDEISLSLLSLGVDLLPPSLADVVADEARYSESVSVLRRYSFVHGTADALSVHFLVQTMVRDRLADDEKRTWAAAAVRIIARAFTEDTREGRTEADTAHLLPHAISSVTYAEPLGAAPEVCARLLNRVGRYLDSRGELTMARSTLERALRIGEATLGAEHPEVATALNNLGFVLQGTGDLVAARAHFERALRISEATLGPE